MDLIDLADLIAADGVTDLLSIGNEYLIAPASGAPGVFLSINGSAVTSGEFGAYTPIAATKTATGYDVVFADVGAGTFVEWTTDATGNSSGGPALAPISSDGATDLLSVGNEYLIAPASGAPGVFLSINGSAVTSGEFGAYTPIAATKTATGYDVVFADVGAGTFVEWTTDATGNSSGGPALAPISSNGVTDLLSVGNEYLIAPASGAPGVFLSINGSAVTSGEFGAYTPIAATKTATGYDVVFADVGAGTFVEWTTDATGNSSGGPALAPISSNGVTDLLSVGNEYLIAPASGAPGVFLSINGSAVTSGEFGAYTPIAATKTATGYDVVFADVGAGTFVEWTTDATGNSSGGPALAPISSDGVTDLLSVGNEYLMAPASGAPGVFLSINGSAVTSGEFGAYTPIGAVKTATGYDVVFADVGAGTFVEWTTDATGNSSGGPALAPISSNGVTDLLSVGSEYLMAPASGGSGVFLSINGHAVTSGEFGGYTPIGAVKTAAGYDVAFRSGSSNQYVVWSTDASGTFTSNITPTVSGQSFALEDLEPTFGEDLNGDGQLSTVLVTSPGVGNILNLSGQTQAETINLGSNNASVSSGLNNPLLGFVNTPDVITLGSGKDIVEYSLTPSSGIETITNFTLGVDELNVDLMGAVNSVLQISSTSVLGVNAISITSTADPTHGVLLLNVGVSETAANLLGSHTTFVAGHALIG